MTVGLSRDVFELLRESGDHSCTAPEALYPYCLIELRHSSPKSVNATRVWIQQEEQHDEGLLDAVYGQQHP